MIDWLLRNIFTFEAITSITLTELFQLYLSYSLVALIIALPFLYLARKEKVDSKLSLEGILIGVPIEDFLFRYLPLAILGSNVCKFAHFIWALCHLKVPTIIFVGIHGLLDLRLWLGGLWVEAIFIHLFHDLLCFVIVKSIKSK